MAENSGTEPRKRKNGPGRPFTSDDPRINRGGRPRAVKELLELARSHAPRAIAVAAGYLDDEAAEPRVRLEAAKLVLAYGLGSPPKQSDDEFSEMTDEQMVEAVLDAVPFEAILAAYRRRAETQGAPRTNQ